MRNKLEHFNLFAVTLVVTAVALLACVGAGGGGTDPAAQPQYPETTQAGDSERATLEVTITGIKGTEGKLLVGLYDSEDDYPDKENNYDGREASVSGDSMTFTFDELPPGEYAIAFLHDENNSGDVDLGITGPEEGIGASRDAEANFGPFDWDDAKIEVKPPVTKIKAKVQY